jgi:hypothetical protein
VKNNDNPPFVKNAIFSQSKNPVDEVGGIFALYYSFLVLILQFITTVFSK